MTANPFTRGTSPGRARPRHRASFTPGHAKRGGRQKGTPNAISPRARKAIAAAAKRLARGTHLIRNHWQRLIDPNALITEALERQGTFTLGGAPRLRSRPFNMKAFCQDLSAVAMRAIKTDQFVDRDLVECLTLLGVRAPSEFAKFLTLMVPKRSYLAARPYAEDCEPRQAVNPGEYRHPPIPEWTLGRPAERVDTGPSRPGADAAGRRPRGLRLTSQSGARLGLEVRQRDKALSSHRPAAQNADSGMDATLRRTARRNDTVPRRPQTEPGTGLPPGIRLAALPGARMEMAVRFHDTAIDTVNLR